MSLSPRSVEIMLNALSDNTYKQYNGCIKSWTEYCSKYNYDCSKASVPIVINFLTEMFDKGAKYGTLNSYKSALSLLFNDVVNDYRIKRFMKGVFRLRPIKPKYNLTWNPSIVLDYLAKQWPNESLNLETLSKKILTLLALVTAHRVQTLSLIQLHNINTQNTNEIIIKIPDIIKTSKPNTFQPVLKLPFYNENPNICPARCLMEYINKTSTIRSSNITHLFVSFKKPHRRVTSQTLSHWIKDTLHKSGVDTSIFSAHSTRHAATSAANRLGVNIDIIRKTAGWSQSSITFAKYYNKEIVLDDSNQFARCILSSETV